MVKALIGMCIGIAAAVALQAVERSPKAMESRSLVTCVLLFSAACLMVFIVRAYRSGLVSFKAVRIQRDSAPRLFSFALMCFWAMASMALSLAVLLWIE